MAKENFSVLDFTSPGSIPIESSEIISRINQELKKFIQSLENILVTDPMETSCWKLLGGLYLAENQIAELVKLQNQYQKLFGKSLFPELDKRNQETEQIIFKLPQNITPELLPNIEAIQQACHSRNKVLIDFSDVRNSSDEGLSSLVNFFQSIAKINNKPEITNINHFILDLEKKATSSNQINNMWDVLFAYKRLCNDVKEFDNLALKFAIQYSISPPSWV